MSNKYRKVKTMRLYDAAIELDPGTNTASSPLGPEFHSGQYNLYAKPLVDLLHSLGFDTAAWYETHYKDAKPYQQRMYAEELSIEVTRDHDHYFHDWGGKIEGLYARVLAPLLLDIRVDVIWKAQGETDHINWTYSGTFGIEWDSETE